MSFLCRRQVSQEFCDASKPNLEIYRNILSNWALQYKGDSAVLDSSS